MNNGKVIPCLTQCLSVSVEVELVKGFSQVVGESVLPLGGEETALLLLNRRDISR